MSLLPMNFRQTFFRHKSGIGDQMENGWQSEGRSVDDETVHLAFLAFSFSFCLPIFKPKKILPLIHMVLSHFLTLPSCNTPSISLIITCYAARGQK